MLVAVVTNLIVALKGHSGAACSGVCGGSKHVTREMFMHDTEGCALAWGPESDVRPN